MLLQIEIYRTIIIVRLGYHELFLPCSRVWTKPNSLSFWEYYILWSISSVQKDNNCLWSVFLELCVQFVINPSNQRIFVLYPIYQLGMFRRRVKLSYFIVVIRRRWGWLQPWQHSWPGFPSAELFLIDVPTSMMQSIDAMCHCVALCSVIVPKFSVTCCCCRAPMLAALPKLAPCC